jgi:hypothetical protein
MMEVKVQCNCGQRFKFDVEPTNGQMPFAVNCPVCGADGTVAANAILAQSAALPQALVASSGTKLQLNRPPPPAAPSVAPPPPVAARVVARAALPSAHPKASGEFNLGLGIVGALAGAAIGAGLMYGFYQWAGFRFPLLGVGIGVLTGYGAKLLFKGTDNTLGVVAGVIALLAVVGTLYLMYGEFPIVSIISVVVSVSVAYRIASG